MRSILLFQQLRDSLGRRFSRIFGRAEVVFAHCAARALDALTKLAASTETLRPIKRSNNNVHNVWVHGDRDMVGLEVRGQSQIVS